MKYIETEKFNHFNISIRTILEFNAKTITTLNLLCILMKRQTEKYPTPDVFVRALADNYGTRINVGLSAYGKQLVMDVRLNAIHPQWIPDENYETQIQQFIDQIMYHPSFTDASLAQAKSILTNRLRTQKDDPNTLALLDALSMLAPHSISIPVQGKIEEIENVTLADIQKTYDMYRSTPKHVYACGKLSPSMYSYLDALDSYQTFQANFQLLADQKLHTKEQSKQIQQTSLTQVYASQIAVDDTLYYPLLVTNSVLGQSPNSLLFTNIREKHSYCYSIYSTIIRFDGALLITTGFRQQYIDQVLALIEQQLQNLRNETYDSTLIESAKKDLVDGLTSGQDSAFSMIEQAFLNDLMHRHIRLEDHITHIQNVTKADIARVSQQLQLVSQSLVKEDVHETL